MGRTRCAAAILAAAVAAALAPTPARALSIIIDDRFDNGFLADPARRSVVEQAAADLGGLFGDALDAIAPGGGQAWTARFTDPTTGLSTSVDDLLVPADTLVVFAGSRDLGGTTLARSAPGTASTIGGADWSATVQLRGQSGAASPVPTDFGPWGGWLSFDADTLWHADLSLTGLAAEEADLYSVALHELSHVLGFGLAGSWGPQVSIGRFTGAHAVSAFGDLVPLAPDQEHWEEGTTGIVDSISQSALMNPTLPLGERHLLTELDVAGLRDVGWTLVPEPTTGLLLASGLLVLARRAARSRTPRGEEARSSQRLMDPSRRTV